MGRRESPGYAEWGDPGPYDAAPYYDAEAPPYPGLDAFASGPPRRRKRSNLPCLIALLLLVLAGTAAGVLFGVVKIQDQKPDAASPSSSIQQQACVETIELQLLIAAAPPPKSSGPVAPLTQSSPAPIVPASSEPPAPKPTLLITSTVLVTQLGSSASGNTPNTADAGNAAYWCQQRGLC